MQPTAAQAERPRIVSGISTKAERTLDSAISLMAGYIGNSRQWRNFEKRAKKLFASFHVDIFHTIDVKRSDKGFKGLTIDKKIGLLDEFALLSHDSLEQGLFLACESIFALLRK